MDLSSCTREAPKLTAEHLAKSTFSSSRIKWLVPIAIGLVALGAGYYVGIGRTSVSTTYEEVVVVRVIDGDTVELADGRRVRYIGIDTPETVHPEEDVECYGTEARDRNRELVEGKIVEMQRGIEDTDKYGRLLRYVHVDGRFVNALLVSEGYAHASFSGEERRFSQVFVQLEQYSKLRDKGMWAACK